MNPVAAVPVGLRYTPFLGPVQYAGRSLHGLREAMSDVAVRHDLEPLHGSFDGLATGLSLGDVQVAFVRYGSPARVVADGTGSLVCWTIPQGAMDVGFGAASPHRTTVGFVLGRDAETTMLPDPRQGAVVITTSETRLNRHLQKLSGHPEERPIDVRPGHALQPASTLVDLAWRQATQVLSRTVSPPRPLMESLEETLLTALLLQLPSRAQQLLAENDDDARGPFTLHTRRAVDWALEHLDSPITLGQWAAAVGVSARHLQKSFDRRHGCSPMQYLLLLRLQRARDLIRSAPSGATFLYSKSSVNWVRLGNSASYARAAVSRSSASFWRSVARYGCPGGRWRSSIAMEARSACSAPARSPLSRSAA